MIGRSLELHSNRGHRALQLHVTGRVDDFGGCVALCDVTLWARAPGEADEDVDAALALSAVPVDVWDLAAFAREARRWADLPLDRLARTPLQTSLRLTPEWSWVAALHLDVGPRPDVVDEGHPVATVRYEVAGLRGELVVVADQSCWRSFANAALLLARDAA